MSKVSFRKKKKEKKKQWILFTFLSFCATARDNRGMSQSIIAYTVRLLGLAQCSVICDLTSWYLPLAEALTEKMMCQ